MRTLAIRLARLLALGFACLGLVSWALPPAPAEDMPKYDALTAYLVGRGWQDPPTTLEATPIRRDMSRPDLVRRAAAAPNVVVDDDAPTPLAAAPQ